MTETSEAALTQTLRFPKTQGNVDSSRGSLRIYTNTSWQPVLRYGESVFTKESQGTEFFVVVALLCKFW